MIRLRWLIALMTVMAATAASPAVQPHGPRSHPPLADERFKIQVRIERGGKTEVVEAPVVLPSSMMPADLTQVVALAEPFPPIRLSRYLPQAVMEQDVAVDETGKGAPAIRLSVEGPTQSYQRWLIGGDPGRDRLTSLIGTWRYMAVDGREQRDALFGAFENELTREPKLLVWRDTGDVPREIAVKPGRVEVIEDLGCTVRVVEFFPDFSIDDRTKKPANRSEKRLNPAALVTIEQGGKTEERWVFARFPDFHSKMEAAAVIQVRLDCPPTSERPLPDFVLVTVDRNAHEVWLRHEGKTVAAPLAVDKKVDIPGCQYAFRVSRFVPSSDLVETYRPQDGRGTVPALRIEVADVSGRPVPTWLEPGAQRVLSTAEGPIVVTFHRQQARQHGGHP